MIRAYLFTLPAVLVCAFTAAGQSFDNSGVGTLHGDYFVREVMITGQNQDGTITAAKSVVGIATFDGKGNFTFNGQSAVSTSSGSPTNLSAAGTYKASGNGFLVMTSLADKTQLCYGGISAIGPAAFVASATEGTGVDILIAIPAGANASNATLKGSYSSAFVDFPNADITMIRQGSFTANADGGGKFGNVTVAGNAVNLGGANTTQTAAGVTYSLTGEGAGSINFGVASSAQLVSGTKNFYISADGNIVMAGSPGGFDLMVGIRSLTGPASNATLSGLSFVAGLEDFVAPPASAGGQPAHSFDGFYGSVNANGQGTSITHDRYQSFDQTVFDYTYDSVYTVPTSGTFAPSDTSYQFTLGANGKAFVATGTGGASGQLYSLLVGFGAPTYSGTGVYLNPLGIVNAANFAPITNPLAPNEVITLYGTGLSSGTATAQILPLPTSLASTQVMINGQAAPLFYVSPTQIVAQAPSNIGPVSQNYYAALQVVNNGMPSNTVTVYTANSAPGVFSAGGNGVGPAAAQHANYSLITAANPAKIGETVVLYGSGLGAVTPAVAAGAAAGSNPPSSVSQPVYVDFSGQQETIAFAGLTPGLAGLYQVNTTLVSGTATNATVYVNLSTTDGLSSQATLSTGGGTTAASVLRTERSRPRPAISPLRPEKSAGLIERAR